VNGKRGGRVCLAGTALLVAVAAGCRVSEPLSSVQAPNNGNQNPNKPNASGCPANQALGTFLPASNVAAGFNTSGTTATYWFASLTNENPANGVPGLIKYCVYSPSSTPTAITPLATGANGAAWTSNSGTQAFSFARPNGDPSNIPLDGASTPISIGTATWTSIPTDQSILLHINDATVCAGLYGVGSQSCFVTPGQATVCIVNAGATDVAYNAIPFGAADCPGASLGFEATSTREFGDEVTLGGTARTLVSLTVLFASYGCETGHWYGEQPQVIPPEPCVTTPGLTFTHPVTANIYDCSSTCPGALLATVTEPLTIPLRPSADDVRCTGADAGKWFNPVSGKCQNSVSVERTFDFTALSVTLPDNVVWTVAFNTTHYGAAPIGELVPCFSSSGGCPYDSFNVGAWTFVNAPYAGTDVDPNGAFLNSVASTSYCDNGAGGVGLLRLDTGATPCWSEFKPLGRILTQQATSSVH